MSGEGRTREAVYLDWLEERLGGAAELDRGGSRLAQFRRTGVLRGRSGLEGPDATIHGTLCVSDPDGFAGLLRRGIGRHRSLRLRHAAVAPGGAAGAGAVKARWAIPARAAAVLPCHAQRYAGTKGERSPAAAGIDPKKYPVDKRFPAIAGTGPLAGPAVPNRQGTAPCCRGRPAAAMRRMFPGRFQLLYVCYSGEDFVRAESAVPRHA